MVLAHTTRVPWNVYAQLPRIIGARNINLPHYPTIGTLEAQHILHRYLQIPGMDVQGLI